MRKYRKVIVAGVGFAILFVKEKFQIEVPWAPEAIVDGLTQLLILFGIYQAKNEE